MILKLFRVLVVCAIGLGVATVASAHGTNKANQTKHVIKTSMKPLKRLGRGTKALGQKVVNLGASAAGFSFLAFDTMVIDPFGVALQAVADGLDMFIAAPLESLPEPFESAGDGVHVAYRGIDWLGVQLAK